MNVQIDPTWKEQLAPEFEKPYFGQLTTAVRQEYQQTTCYPPGRLIFNAFNLCPFDQVKVVIITLAIISALIHKPKLLVLDEPFVGLDPKATFPLKEIMHEMCKKGTAVFFSTHVLDVAEKLCNKVAIIRKGRIIDSGTMEEMTEGHSLEEVFLEVENEQ